MAEKKKEKKRKTDPVSEKKPGKVKKKVKRDKKN